MAAAAETSEVPNSIAPERAAEPPESQELEKVSAIPPTTAATEPTGNLSEPASSDSRQTAETEAPHAEEIQKEP